jgi:hypothetical protein
LDILYNIAKLFNYKSFVIYNNYEHFFKFNKNYESNKINYLYSHLYDSDIYNYLKYNIKPFNNPYIVDFTHNFSIFDKPVI